MTVDTTPSPPPEPPPPPGDGRTPPVVGPRERRRAWVWLMLAIVSGASGTSALSRTQGFTQWLPTAATAVLYVVCFVALTRALRVIPVSIAYAVWSGIGIALVSGIGWIAFDQPLNAGELLGIGLILAGTVVIQLWSKAAHAGPGGS